MSEFTQIIRALFRMTTKGDITWEASGDAFFAWVGEQCYVVKRESLLGLQTKDSLAVRTAGQLDWQVLGVSEHGVLSSLGLLKDDPPVTVSKKVTTLHDKVRDKVHQDALKASLRNLTDG